MKHPPYPSYRPSGVEWLGDVPEDWTVSRLKHATNQIGSGGTPDTDVPEYWADSDDDGAAWVSNRDRILGPVGRPRQQHARLKAAEG